MKLSKLVEMMQKELKSMGCTFEEQLTKEDRKEFRNALNKIREDLIRKHYENNRK